MLVRATETIAIQINGRTRATIELPANTIGQDAAVEAARQVGVIGRYSNAHSYSAGRLRSGAHHQPGHSGQAYSQGVSSGTPWLRFKTRLSRRLVWYHSADRNIKKALNMGRLVLVRRRYPVPCLVRVTLWLNSLLLSLLACLVAIPPRSKALALYDESAAGRIFMRGRDRADLLHRLSTADLLKRRPGQGVRTVLTTPIGRIIDLLTVHSARRSLLP